MREPPRKREININGITACKWIQPGRSEGRFLFIAPREEEAPQGAQTEPRTRRSTLCVCLRDTARNANCIIWIDVLQLPCLPLWRYGDYCFVIIAEARANRTLFVLSHGCSLYVMWEKEWDWINLFFHRGITWLWLNYRRTLLGTFYIVI